MNIGGCSSTRPESHIRCSGATAGLLVLSAVSAMAVCSTACMAAVGRIRWTATWLTAAATAGFLVSALSCCRRPDRTINRDPGPAGAPARSVPVEPQVSTPPNPELLPRAIRATFDEIQAEGGINPADVQRPTTLAEFAPLLRAVMRVNVIGYRQPLSAWEESGSGSRDRRYGVPENLVFHDTYVVQPGLLFQMVHELMDEPGSQLFVKAQLFGKPEYFRVTKLTTQYVSMYWWNWSGATGKWTCPGHPLMDIRDPLLFVIIRPPEVEPAGPAYRPRSSAQVGDDNIRAAFDEIEAAGGINPADIQQPRSLLDFAPLLRAGMRLDFIDYQDARRELSERGFGDQCQRLRELADVTINERLIRNEQELIAAVRQATGSQIFVQNENLSMGRYFRVTEFDQNEDPLWWCKAYWWEWKRLTHQWNVSGGPCVRNCSAYRMQFLIIRPPQGAVS